MTKFLRLLLIFFPFTNFAQDKKVITINSLPQKVFVLNEGWKWHAGDDAGYAKLSFNDSVWESINPATDIKELPKLWKANINWLRFYFDADSITIVKTYLLQINQNVASEIFLDGTLIGGWGKIGNDKNKTIAFAPGFGNFVGLPTVSQGRHLLAVRLAIQKNIHYTDFLHRPNFLFSAELLESTNINTAIAQRNILPFEFARVGIFLVLALLHLGLYLFNTSQKSNLYFSVFSLLILLQTVFGSLLPWQTVPVAHKFRMFSIIIFTGLLSFLFLLIAVYQIFKTKKGLIFSLLATFALVIFIIAYFGYENGFNDGTEALFVFGLLVPFEILRLSWISVQSKLPGANIIFGGFLCYVLLTMLFYLFVFGILNPGQNWVFGDIAYNLSVVAVPFSISLYLAMEASVNAKALKIKINEVTNLALEKQQILATQNETLEKQVEARTAQLKASQAQLIQSEKMASLGELTAGIAHEIQNPLNFVNNFSDVNKDLLAEMKDEMDKGNLADAKEIADDVIANEEKINHHGKRADAIVKGMLQHSRTSTGHKEPTNINALCDEYLRLAYHGLRAKDKSFNATLKTNFDETTGNINIVPQDIGRVLLNLINNAFYAVTEKKKQHPGEYEPTVSVTTTKKNQQVEIIVSDNGNGIPQKIIDKIFQPFFTTKPTGQGTGLGLSLSYDIVKAHGGELKVTTNENEGSIFIIVLPTKLPL